VSNSVTGHGRVITKENRFSPPGSNLMLPVYLLVVLTHPKKEMHKKRRMLQLTLQIAAFLGLLDLL
jgi:hypothetical protein